jgi:copper oxidase (laccase) domain-containing protein
VASPVESEPESDIEPEPIDNRNGEIKEKIVAEVAKETGEAVLDAILPGAGQAYEVGTAFVEAASGEGKPTTVEAAELPEAPPQQKRIKIRKKQRIENGPETSC